MAKSNYQAWHISSDNFSEDWSDIQKLLFFAEYAVLAPSGHNTQPWHFRCNDSVLILELNSERNLPFSGALAAEPFVSLGACLETLVLAAKGFGYELNVTYNLKANLIASIKLGKTIQPDEGLLSAIVSRVSNRNKYVNKPPKQDTFEQITGDKLRYVSTHLVEEKQQISFLAQQTELATKEIMSKPEFRAELSKWVRSNITKKYDGMPGFVQGMPTPPSLIAKYIIRNIDISKAQAKKDAELVINSGAVAMISVEKSNSEAFLNVGRMYARICVLAQQRGISTSGIGAAVIDPLTKRSIKKHFMIVSQPTALVRLGKTTHIALHSPRWPLEKVLG